VIAAACGVNAPSLAHTGGCSSDDSTDGAPPLRLHWWQTDAGLRPGLRLAFGSAIPAAPTPAAPGPRFAFDAQINWTGALARTVAPSPDVCMLIVRPEIGLAYDDWRMWGGARLTTGLGLGLRVHDGFDLLATGSVVLGVGHAPFDTGARVGIRFEVIHGLLGVETSYQYVHVGAADIHEIVLLVSTDVIEDVLLTSVLLFLRTL
jgi:hypothetical protein